MKCKRCIHYPYDGFTGEIRHFNDDLIEGSCEMGISEDDQKFMGPYASNSCPYFEEHFIETCLTCKYFYDTDKEKDSPGNIGRCMWSRAVNLAPVDKVLYGITPCARYKKKENENNGQLA